jgi:Mg2+ and Co2+ transporter CorA
MIVTKKIKAQLLEEADWKCEYCGKALDEYTAMVDHKIPPSKGGSSERENLAIACPKCNIMKADRLLESISKPVESAAKLWIHAFLKSPKTTVAISLFSLVFAAVAIFLAETQRQEELESELSQNPDFRAQIEELSETEETLQQLLRFVSQQKDKIEGYEKSIEDLETEKQKLEPLVNADRAKVEAFFRAQEERAQEKVFQERYIGFGLGVLASFVASFLLFIGRYFIAKRMQRS